MVCVLMQKVWWRRRYAVWSRITCKGGGVRVASTPPLPSRDSPTSSTRRRIRNFAAAAREHPVGGGGDLCCSRPPPPVIAGEESNASAALLLLLLSGKHHVPLLQCFPRSSSPLAICSMKCGTDQQQAYSTSFSHNFGLFIPPGLGFAAALSSRPNELPFARCNYLFLSSIHTCNSCRFWVEMEVVLQARDANDWVYKGEGAANLILSYTGSSPSMLGKVLRVKKILKDKAQPAPNCIVFSSYEQLLWGEIPELVESVKQDCLAQAYAIHVMSQHLGANHVDGGVRVRVSRDFLELVQKNVLSNRPAWRVNASSIDTNADSALLISDHSLFSGNPRGSNCIAVEIKAKCGFLSSSEYVSKENSIKKQVTRYKMHQHLKFHQGEVSRISEYDPLDLFSGSKERIRMAIKSFFSTPQNNFRIFVNGSLVFGGMGGGADSVHPNETERCLEDLSKVSGLQISDFIDLLSEAIFKSGVLGKLLATQKLDDHDIEGAIHLYYNIISQPCLVCKDIADAELLRKYATLHSLSLENSQKIVRDFLISATAKDCSLMISFRPRESGATESEYDSVFLESVNQIYDYKAYFVDLDVKPLDKMVHYFKLDQKIVNFYTRSGEVGRDSCDSPKRGGNGDDAKIQLQH